MPSAGGVFARRERQGILGEDTHVMVTLDQTLGQPQLYRHVAAALPQDEQKPTRLVHPDHRRQARARNRSAPGEDRLPDVVHPLVGLTAKRDLSELVENRSGRCMDEVVAQRKLKDRLIALGNGEKARVGIQQRVEPDSVDRQHLVRSWDDGWVCRTPENHWSDHESGASGVVVKPAKHILAAKTEPEFLAHLAYRGLYRRLAGIEPSPRERPLPGVST